MTMPRDPVEAEATRQKYRELAYKRIAEGKNPMCQKGKFSHLKGKTYEEIHGFEKAAELKKKRANSALGHVVSDESRKKIGIGNRGRRWKRKSPLTEVTRKNMSLSKLNSISLRKFDPQKNRFKAISKYIGTTKAGEVFCQGSWEIAYVIKLDSDPSVLRFEKDKIRLSYLYEGKNRIYIVDFLVWYVDGRKELVEIKPSTLVNKDENPTKFEAARSWCSKNNVEFVVLTEKELIV